MKNILRINKGLRLIQRIWIIGLLLLSYLIILSIALAAPRFAYAAKGGGRCVAALCGSVKSGANAVSGATVTLWEAGSSGYGSAPTQLFQTTSATSGAFSFSSLPCTNQPIPVYLTAVGGNAGGGSNSAIGMMAVLGACNRITLPTTVTLNEATTVASVYAAQQFIGTNPQNIGSTPTNMLVGLPNAMITATNMVNMNTGTVVLPSTKGKKSSFIPPVADRLDTIAQALLKCDQSSGSSSQACTELFKCATPNATFVASSSGPGNCTVPNNSAVPTDTLSATLSIATNSGSIPVAGIEDVGNAGGTSTVYYTPWGRYPSGFQINDFTLGIFYSLQPDRCADPYGSNRN